MHQRLRGAPTWGGAGAPAPPLGVTSRGGEGGDVADGGVAASLAAFADPDVLAKTLTLPFGAMPGAAFLRLATLETFTHGWDLVKVTGQSADLNPQLAQALLADARQTIPDTVRGSASPPAPSGRS